MVSISLVCPPEPSTTRVLAGVVRRRPGVEGLAVVVGVGVDGFKRPFLMRSGRMVYSLHNASGGRVWVTGKSGAMGSIRLGN